MIKINLLPYQKAAKVKRQQLLEAQLLISVLIVIAVVGLMGFIWWSFNIKIAALQTNRDDMRVQLETLKEKVKEVDDVEKKKKQVEQKIAIIDQLKKNQQGPVRVLDELSRHLPDRVWLTSLSEQATEFTLQGRAMTNFDIVEYVNRLRTSDFVVNVQLLESRQSTEQSLKVFNFSLRFNLKT